MLFQKLYILSRLELFVPELFVYLQTETKKILAASKLSQIFLDHDKLFQVHTSCFKRSVAVLFNRGGIPGSDGCEVPEYSDTGRSLE